MKTECSGNCAGTSFNSSEGSESTGLLSVYRTCSGQQKCHACYSAHDEAENPIQDTVNVGMLAMKLIKAIETPVGIILNTNGHL